MLTFVPTPIGNLADISFRALESLKDCEIILCEDTRVTKKLINLINQKLNYTIDSNKEFYSVHSHNENSYTSNDFIELYKTKNVLYLSDAGMPCVSDPGAILVQTCIEHDIQYDVLPGANALLTAYAMSGFNKKEFTFYGFLPHKTINRKTPLAKIMNSEYLTILYESTHRIEQLIHEIYNLDANKEIFIVKELTKLHQQSYKGTACDIYYKLKNIDLRGEWVVIIDSTKSLKGEQITLEDLHSLKLPPKEKAKIIAKLTGENIKDIYNNLCSK
jgi:16S rRNA (cytidine1402-2'-O)-methyltransferase